MHEVLFLVRIVKRHWIGSRVLGHTFSIDTHLQVVYPIESGSTSSSRELGARAIRTMAYRSTVNTVEDCETMIRFPSLLTQRSGVFTGTGAIQETKRLREKFSRYHSIKPVITATTRLLTRDQF